MHPLLATSARTATDTAAVVPGARQEMNTWRYLISIVYQFSWREHPPAKRALPLRARPSIPACPKRGGNQVSLFLTDPKKGPEARAAVPRMPNLCRWCVSLVPCTVPYHSRGRDGRANVCVCVCVNEGAEDVKYLLFCQRGWNKPGGFCIQVWKGDNRTVTDFDIHLQLRNGLPEKKTTTTTHGRLPSHRIWRECL